MDAIKIVSEKRVTAIAVALSVCYCAYTAHALYTSSPERYVQFVPDDAYYYLALARNFVTHGQWTFDSGVSLTTGFHPLHAYALVAIHGLVNPSPEQFVQLGMIMSFVLALLSVFAAALFAIKTGRLVPGMVLLLFVLSRNISLNTISVVEWGWVVLLHVLYYYFFYSLGRLSRTTTFASMFLVGLLGSLARTDFGLLPAALAVSSIFAVRTPAGWNRFVSASIGLGGAFLGVIVALCHNYITTGQYLQSSARMKHLWLDSYGASVRPIIGKALSLFGDDFRRMLIPVGVIALCAIILGIRRFLPDLIFSSSRKETSAVVGTGPVQAMLWLGSLLTIVGYVIVYSLNPAGIQNWYTATIVVPIFLAVSLPFVNTRSNHPLHVAALTLLTLLLVTQAFSAKRFLSRPEWPHAISMLHAGRFLEGANLEGRVGSWNAGIIGYYEGGHVVNLDGLVNNDIFRYARRNELPRYIDERDIRYILDFDNMFDSEQRRKRGGYDCASFLDRLRVVRTFDNRSSGWRGLTLYEVTKGELATPKQSLPADTDWSHR